MNAQQTLDFNEEQREQITRVGGKIGKHVLNFMRSRCEKTFFASELLSYVSEVTDGYIAPDSPNRIMRDLRKHHLVDYEVVNRRESLYRVKWVALLVASK